MPFIFCCAALMAQQEKKYVAKGNKLYTEQRYKEAEQQYLRSLKEKEKSVEGNFNLGDALYRQKSYEKSAALFNKLAESRESNNNLRAAAYHNMGNSLLASQKYAESIEAYKKALLRNPSDEATRYNLAYAQEKLKQQQNKDKQKKQDDKKNKDQNKDQQKKDQEDKQQKQEKDKQDNKDQKQDGKEKGQQPEPDKLSKEDAERMLEALNNQEKNTQDKLNDKKFRGGKVKISKDW